MAGSAAGPFHYRPEILAALAGHGLRPRPTNDPRAVYELLKSLYSWELRRLKIDYRELERRIGPQPIANYREAARRVLERYDVLRQAPHEWLDESP